MSGHTPGPWETSGTYLTPAGAIGIGTPEVVRPDIACAFDIDDEPQQEANARLIAAAPELLEALQIMEAAEDELEIAKALEIGQAAIAKATGEQDLEQRQRDLAEGQYEKDMGIR